MLTKRISSGKIRKPLVDSKVFSKQICILRAIKAYNILDVMGKPILSYVFPESGSNSLMRAISIWER